MKTRIVVSVSLFVLILATANLLPSQAQRRATATAGTANEPPILDQGARLNPLKVALLHWYLADVSTRVRVGNEPYGA